MCTTAIGDPWADHIFSYEAGTGLDPAYTNPYVVLGQPERMTGEGIYPGAVTPFNPPWLPEEIVGIGEGGHLTVQFDEPIKDDPAHAFGVDFLLFGNGFLLFGGGGTIGELSEEGPFTISVSADGDTFVPLAGEHYDAMFPQLGYLDLTDPYDPNPGSVPSNYTRPVDPSLTFEGDFVGKTFEELVELYDGSGGGIPFDISPTGLSAVSYVRVDVPLGASSPEFDAFAAVPEPASFTLLVILAFGGDLRRGR